MMYLSILTLHSWMRWLVLALGLITFVRAVTGARRGWQQADDRLSLVFSILLDIQVLIGLGLYAVYSPITRDAFGDFGAAMRTSSLRFWAVEHGFGMLIALALVHMGRVRIRKGEPSRRARTAAIFFGLSLLAMLISLPWPGTPNGRPLLRW